MAWRAQGPWSLLATLVFLFAGILLVATQFRHLPARAAMVASPYLLVLVYVLVDSWNGPTGWPLVAAVLVGGSAILTKVVFGQVHKRQIDAFQAEQARLIAALEIAHQDATAASAAKSAFLAVISHELRTPMNGVLGAAQLLRRRRLAADTRDLVAVIDDQGRALAALLDDILDFARIEAGRLEITPVPTEIGSLVRRLTKLWSARAEEKGLTLQLSLAEEACVCAHTDPLRLSQMLHNLLSNAIKFTEAGTVWVDVNLVRVGQQERLQIAVVDTGPGIAEASQDRLFQAFSQVMGRAPAVTGARGWVW
jgi:signal transduction histidine kinase